MMSKFSVQPFDKNFTIIHSTNSISNILHTSKETSATMLQYILMEPLNTCDDDAELMAEFYSFYATEFQEQLYQFEIWYDIEWQVLNHDSPEHRRNKAKKEFIVNNRLLSTRLTFWSYTVKSIANRRIFWQHSRLLSEWHIKYRTDQILVLSVTEEEKGASTQMRYNDVRLFLMNKLKHAYILFHQTDFFFIYIPIQM